MKNKIMKVLSLCLCMMLIAINVDTRLLYANEKTAVKIKEHSVEGNTEKPADFQEGQIWSDKSVLDHGDGTFTITLSAYANNYENKTKQALKQSTVLTLTDVIGEGFDVDGTLPESLKRNGSTLEWTLQADQVAVLQTVSFKVKSIANKAGTYYTNAKANAVFTPNDDNPYYYDYDTANTVFTPKSTFQWNEKAVSTNLEAKGVLTIEEIVEEETEQKNQVNIKPFTNAGPLVQQVSNPSIDEDNGLETSKTASFDPKIGKANISLEAFTTGEVKSGVVPSDIILVLDQSGSMANQFGKTKYIPVNDVKTNERYYIKLNPTQETYTRVRYDDDDDVWYYKLKGNDRVIVTPKLNGNKNSYQFYKEHTVSGKEALKENVSLFIEAVKADATEKMMDHRIAMVGFASNNNNELLSVTGKKSVSYSGATNQDYADSFQDVTTDAGRKKLDDAVDLLDDFGATNTNIGMKMANKILQNDTKKDEVRNKIVIVFTDGVPTTSDTFSNSVANEALVQSNYIKNDYYATVYSIGVFDGADPKGDNPDRVNRFMHYLSSNYENINDVKDLINGTPNNEGYYMAASNTDELKNIFDKIVDQIKPLIKLDEKTILKDVISNYFKIPQRSKVDVYTADYKGKDASGKRQWAEKKPAIGITTSINGDSISVTGFNYAKNTVFDGNNNVGAGGKKLIVEITDVEPIDGFIGGNKVPTNKSNSGIYDKNKVVEYFEEPTVDVPLNFEIKVNDASIYLGDHWNDIESFLETNGKVTYLQNGREYEFGGYRNDFVNVDYKIMDNSQVVGNYTINSGNSTGSIENLNLAPTTSLTDKKEFKINANVTPITEATVEPMTTNSKSAYLYIYKPEVKVSDDLIFYGEKVVLNDRINSNVVWSCENKNAPLPKTEKPSLNIATKKVVDNTLESIDHTNEIELEEDTRIKLEVKRGNSDITNHTNVVNTNKIDQTIGNHDFSILLLKGQLNIKKTINQQYTSEKKIKANQSFVFKIDRKDTKTGKVVETFYQTISFSANENDTTKTAVIKGLKRGYYTVTELQDWSWKYKLTSQSDNYSFNTSGKTENIYIGERGYNKYFGTEEDTNINNVAYGNPAITNYKNDIKATLSNIFGDVASALNKFSK